MYRGLAVGGASAALATPPYLSIPRRFPRPPKKALCQKPVSMYADHECQIEVPNQSKSAVINFRVFA